MSIKQYINATLYVSIGGNSCALFKIRSGFQYSLKVD